MGKIDKEKLLKELRKKFDDKTYCYDVCECIREFPEEPVTAIDFDALRREWEILPLDHNETFVGAVSSFSNFLKSKNLCAPAKRELQAKTIYTLKKEYQDVFKDFGFLHSTFDTHSYEPLPENIKKYYDRTDEVDYTQIPKGSIVEMHGGFIRAVDHIENDKMYLRDCEYCVADWKFEDFVRVVEWAKEV